MKEERLLRIGVLGCGPVSQIAHFDACRKARNVELYAICDVAGDLLDRMKVVHGPRCAYGQYADMLADTEVEAILIGVADQYHVSLAEQALAAGKHVLVEKPLGVTVEECERLVQTVRRCGCILQVGHNRRFDPGVQFAAQFVREELGRILALKAWYCDSTLRYTMTDNLQPIPVTSTAARRPEGNPKADRAKYFLLTHGSHLVDTTRFLGGELTAVRARLFVADDAHCWFVEVEFASGALGHLDLTIPIRGDFEEGFQIYGQGGSVKGNLFLPWYHKSSVVECFSARNNQFRRPLGEDAHSYKRQLESFAAAILDGRPMEGATVEDGLAGMRTMVAIARSVESGRRVSLAEVTGGV